MDQSKNFSKELRTEPRETDLNNCRVEIKLIGKPLYQFKLKDISNKGAGVLIKDDSGFLNLIDTDQNLEADFIASKASKHAGMHKAQIKHITKIEDGRYKGHRLVGISILERLD